MHRRRTAPLAALTLALTLALGACGGEDTDATDAATTSPSTEPSTSQSPTDSPSDAGSEDAGESETRIEVTRKGDSFTPLGERVEAAVGEPITLVITADTAGEMHVHSTPEQEIAYEAGTTEHRVTIDRPGVVEVESHDPDVVVLQLEVR
jgi:hypothetical protein